MVLASIASVAHDSSAEDALRTVLDVLPSGHIFRVNPLNNLALIKHAQGQEHQAVA